MNLSLSPRVAQRTLAALAAVALLPLLAACSGDTDEPVTADAAASVTTDAPVDGIDVDDTGDPFCDLAIDTIPVGDEIAAQTEGLTTLLSEALTTGDVATLNTWGANLAVLDQQMLDFYAEGRQYITGEPIEADWDSMESFVRDYSLVLANEAAVAVDTSAFTLRLAEIASDARTQELMTAAPAAAAEIKVYVEDRCDITG